MDIIIKKMKHKKIFLTATSALLILAASCGQNAQNSQASHFSKEPQQQSSEEMAQEMTEKQFASLMKEIYYQLPESVMCEDLKTDRQRKSVNINSWGDSESINDVNHLSYNHYYGEGTSVQWDMAGYLTDNHQDVVVVVRLWASVREEYETKFDKTFNYHIKSGKITEIERPIDPFTLDELINETHFDTPELAVMAKAFYRIHKHPVRYFDFDRNGFIARANLLGYAPYDDPWDEQNRVIVIREWNGRKFVKGDRLYAQKLGPDDYIPGDIGYQGEIVEAYRYFDKTGENIVILAESDVLESPENEYGDVEYYKNIYAYRFLKKGDDWEEVWRVYEYSDLCFNHPAAEFIKGSFTLTDLNKDGVAETWIIYIKSCKGDVSPDPMFLIMNDNLQSTYTMSGFTKVVMSDGEEGFVEVGGEYELGDKFLHRNTPPTFVNFAKNLWEKHI